MLSPVHPCGRQHNRYEYPQVLKNEPQRWYNSRVPYEPSIHAIYKPWNPADLLIISPNADVNL